MIQHWSFGPVPLAGEDGHARQAGLTAIVMVRTGERSGNLADRDTSLGHGIEMAREIWSLCQKAIGNSEVIAVDQRPANAGAAPNFNRAIGFDICKHTIKDAAFFVIHHRRM